MTAPAPVPVERLAAELRDVRARLVDRPAPPSAWCELLDEYDELLALAAAMLDVELPPAPAPYAGRRPRFCAGTRAIAEARLAAAGLHVRQQAHR